MTGVNEEKIWELKSKIVLLKKAPNESDPGMVPCWEKGERVPFIILRLVSDMISTEKERIVINHTVCNMLRTVMEIMPDDLLPVVCLAGNKIAPSHEGLELVRLVRNHIQRSRSTQTYAKREYPRKPQAEHLVERANLEWSWGYCFYYSCQEAVRGIERSGSCRQGKPFISIYDTQASSIICYQNFRYISAYCCGIWQGQSLEEKELDPGTCCCSP